MLQAAIRPRHPVLRDRKNDLCSDIRQPNNVSQFHGPREVSANRDRLVPSTAAAQCRMVRLALSKQRVKQLSAWFEAWHGVAKEGQVNLQGAGSMLKWRKLLRIWKVLPLMIPRCQSCD